MQVDLEFLKTKANYIRYSFIKDMERHLLSFETGILDKKSNIAVKWISDEENLYNEFKLSLSKSSYNKVCFDVNEIPDIFLEKKNFIKQISVEDLAKNDVAEHLVIQADFGIVENSSIVFVNKKSLNYVNNINSLHIILNLNDFIIKKQDLETILYLKYDCNSNSQNFPTNINFLHSSLNQVISNSVLISQEANFSIKNIPIYVYLYDNCVTDLLEDPILRESLFCIHCGKCKQVCPVYQITNKYSPIELIREVYFNDNSKDLTLFQNTTLCGNCNQVCPVQIPFTDLLIDQMQKIRSIKSSDKSYSLFKLLMKRTKMNKMNSPLRRFFFVNRYYRKNQKLHAYYKNQTLPFFNLTYNENND